MNKNPITISIGLMISFNAFANVSGLPSEDIVVASIQREFLKAKAMTLADLVEVPPLACRSYVALAGDFERQNVKHTISEKFNSLWTGSEFFFAPSGSSAEYRYTYLNDEKGQLVGQVDHSDQVNPGQDLEYFREDAKNVLIENTTIAPDGNFNASPAIARPNSFVTQYIVCPKS